MKPWPEVDLEISGDAELVKRVRDAFTIHDQLLLRQRLNEAQQACEDAKRTLERLKSMPWPQQAA